MDLQKLINEAEWILQSRIERRARRYPEKKPLPKAFCTRLRKEILAALVEYTLVIEQIRKSGFILCGSRYFGDAERDSDWDFFIEASDAARELLERLGFQDDHTHGCSDYRDGNTLEIYVYHPALSDCGWNWREEWPRSMQIHASLVRSRRLREKAREIFKDEPKRVRSNARTWDLLYARLAADSIESEAGGGGAEPQRNDCNEAAVSGVSSSEREARRNAKLCEHGRDGAPGKEQA
jgi:hypothetical protein